MHRPFLIAIILTLCALTLSAQQLELQLSHEKCMPGDTVVLEATLQTPQIHSFQVQLPSHPSLSVHSPSKFPTTIQNGLYTTKATWLIQPIDSGEINWSGIKATITRGENHTEYLAPPLTLTVENYPAPDPSSAPELLSNPAPQTNSHHPILLAAALLAIAAIATLSWKLRNKKSNTPTSHSTATTPTLSSIIDALETGSIPTQQITSYLDSSPTNAEQNAILQRAIYGKQLPAHTVLEQLKATENADQEVQP